MVYRVLSSFHILNFRIINVTGPSNTRRYTVAVYFCGERLATGVNYVIQSAELTTYCKFQDYQCDRPIQHASLHGGSIFLW